MSVETEEGGQVLCSIHLSRRAGGGVLSAELRTPVADHSTGAAEGVKDWGCMVTIVADGVQHRRVMYSVSWLSSFLLALKYVRTFVPEGEECEWIDENGVESWCVLPRFVPFGWGHELYHQISRMSDEAERAFESEVQSRRLDWERKRGTAEEE
jgi:hypothetical protein